MEQKLCFAVPYHHQWSGAIPDHQRAMARVVVHDQRLPIVRERVWDKGSFRSSCSTPDELAVTVVFVRDLAAEDFDQLVMRVVAIPHGFPADVHRSQIPSGIMGHR
jgi:hypothetical protein